MKNRDPLAPAVRTFVTHWGEMGTRWGINRTVAQIHGLLFLSERPLHADDIVEVLGVARSNVSTSLKELVGWGIVKMVHLPEDRRDHFTSLTDVWELFRVITAERKRREFDPTVAALGELIKEPGAESAEVRRRLGDLHQFMSTMGEALEQVRTLPPGALAGLLGAAGLIRNLMPRRGRP